MATATLNDRLSFHKASQQFCKTVNGRRFYLGRDEAEAYRIWRECKADFALGIDPRREGRSDGMTLRHGANLFLASKESRLTAGEIKPKSFREYISTCKRFVDFFGDRAANTLLPQHYNQYKVEIAKVRKSPVTQGNEISRVRELMGWLYDSRYIDRPHYGPEFRRPKKEIIRKYLRQKKQNGGERTLEPHEILGAINELSPHYRAGALLGINAAYGPTDLVELPRSAIDYEVGEISFPRPKTQVDRRCVLWVETIEALQLSERYSKGGDRFFDFSYAMPSKKFNAALKAVKAYRGPQTGFYSLRHCFATIARQASDDAAVRVVMGHTDDNMLDEFYTHRFPRERLDAVSNCVRNWLFGKGGHAK